MLQVIEPRPSERSYQKVRHAIPEIEWPAFADDIDAIMALKERRNAVILAHNYQTPEIFHCVADIVGDSLALAVPPDPPVTEPRQRSPGADRDRAVTARDGVGSGGPAVLGPQRSVDPHLARRRPPAATSPPDADDLLQCSTARPRLRQRACPCDPRRFGPL